MPPPLNNHLLLTFLCNILDKFKVPEFAKKKEVFMFDMHPKSWTAFGGAYFYVKEKEIQHKVLARV